MVAYSFQPQFIRPILLGTKPQTIRKDRLGNGRHARIGDELQLYRGMRTRHCRLIARATCEMVRPVKIELPDNVVSIVNGNTETFLSGWDALDKFARMDGFDGWLSMREFWREHHPKVEVFQGVLITWAGLRPVMTMDELAA